ncbi:hypothetical protein BGZ57DRAFT_765234 [Hyaloscypha finlandica]|nr:hypothetical protein BGZ57DRAFT_765234 [Hyaloscypha finlandica]
MLCCGLPNPIQLALGLLSRLISRSGNCPACPRNSTNSLTFFQTPLSENDGNFIFFASGIGITAHVGSMKQLLNARDQGPTNTRVISLLWEVDEIERWDMAIKMVHQLLDQDRDRCQKEAPDWPHASSRYVSYLIELS